MLAAYLVIALLSALAGGVIVALAWAAKAQHERVVALGLEISKLRDELANVTRVRTNRLYKEKLEDIGFAASQGALRVAALRAQMEDELRVIEAILARKD